MLLSDMQKWFDDHATEAQRDRTEGWKACKYAKGAFSDDDLRFMYEYHSYIRANRQEAQYCVDDDGNTLSLREHIEQTVKESEQDTFRDMLIARNGSQINIFHRRLLSALTYAEMREEVPDDMPPFMTLWKGVAWPLKAPIVISNTKKGTWGNITDMGYDLIHSCIATDAVRADYCPDEDLEDLEDYFDIVEEEQKLSALREAITRTERAQEKAQNWNDEEWVAMYFSQQTEEQRRVSAREVSGSERQTRVLLSNLDPEAREAAIQFLSESGIKNWRDLLVEGDES